MQMPAAVAGQKRKRHQVPPPPDGFHPMHESKNQRKKRRKAERLAAEQARMQDARSVEIPLSPPVASRSKLAPLPVRPVTFRDTQQSGTLFPVSWAASFTAHTALMPPAFSSLPPKPPPLTATLAPTTNPLPPYPMPPMLPQIPERRQQPSHGLPPLPPTMPPVPTFPLLQQPHGAHAPESEQPPLAQKKILGMPRESDKGRQGVFPTETLRHPLPDPTRTLILAPIPKKFRSTEFVKHWAKKFAQPQSLRIEVDKIQGKALVEFQSVAHAEMAHSSIRLVGEGKEHIRAWWYRGPAKNPSDLEEGEIEEGVVEEPAPQPQTSKKKQNKNQKKMEKKKAQAAAHLQRQQHNTSIPYTTPKTDFDASSSGRPFASLMPNPLSQAVPPTFPSTPVSNTPLPVASFSRTTFRRSPSPRVHRSWADLMERADKYGLASDDSECEDAFVDTRDRTSRYHGTFSRSSYVYQQEEQAMDLESDEEETGTRQEKYSPDSRYIALAETAVVPDSAVADSASIASSRAASAEKESVDQMRVDDASVSVPPPTVAAQSCEATLKASINTPNHLKPPSKTQSPSVYTMVEPPTAPVPVPGLDVLAAAEVPGPSHPTVQYDRFSAGGFSTHPEREPAASSATSLPLQDLPSASLPSSLIAAHLPPSGSPSDIASTSSHPGARAEPSARGAHAKRTLLEKQRELEERIAKAKEELARKSVVSRTSASRHTSPGEEPIKPEGAINKAARSADMTSAESELRRSALQSRRKTGAASAEGMQDTNRDSALNSGKGGASIPATIATPSAINFDDLAVSFITETLQTVRSSPPSDPPSAATSLSSHSAPSTAPTTPRPLPAIPSVAPHRSSQVTEKLLLAARQKRLEQHLAETKMLMTKLGAARTKAEKDHILGTLRERQR